jgi:glutamyl-tRNA synthetase
MAVRVRFAPSPTGQVHIGNIRAAIFNWLFARHAGGAFLLRIEDTDLERSTPAAIATLLDVMQWLGLDFDDAPMYQTQQCDEHTRAAARLLAQGDAYASAKGGEGEAIIFRIPWDTERVPGVVVAGAAQVAVHASEPVRIGVDGVQFAAVSGKGTPVPGGACLAGFRGLEVVGGAGQVLFRLDDVSARVLAGESFTVEGAAQLRFTRRAITYTDLVKGVLSKPLDSMRDFVIVRSDGSPVFHLANVVDDVTMRITHIIRGDDHVENTYRHLFLFHALGAAAPAYAHLPMIVNASGKPYSKRDGDAFVGDFRDKGYLPEALFNYLTLLGWNPGDEREKLSRAELVQLFSLERVQQSSAQMDATKLQNLNGQYIADLPFAVFLAGARPVAAATPWGGALDEVRLAAVARLLQSRTKLWADVAGWDYFFVDLPAYDEKAVRKFLAKPGVPEALENLATALAQADFTTPAAIEAVVAAVTAGCGIEPGRLNQPIRVAITGCTVGAGVYETLGVLGRETALRRLGHAVTLARATGGQTEQKAVAP